MSKWNTFSKFRKRTILSGALLLFAATIYGWSYRNSNDGSAKSQNKSAKSGTSRLVASQGNEEQPTVALTPSDSESSGSKSGSVDASLAESNQTSVAGQTSAASSLSSEPKADSVATANATSSSSIDLKPESQVASSEKKEIKENSKSSIDPIVVPAEVPAPIVQEKPKVDTELVRDFWLWMGGGVNFTTYSQSVPGFSDVSFGRLRAPSTVGKAGFFFSDHFGVDLGYKDTPGEATAGDIIAVSHGSYNWKTMSAEMIYRPANFDDGYQSEWLWRFGAQQHQMPFIVPLTANSIDIRENSLTALSVGAEYRKFTRKKVRVEAMLRYQHPVGSSSDAGTNFSLKPKLTVDGSLGAAYEIKKNLFIGTYWYGQYHSYSFDYQNSSGTAFSGNQTLFFTNFDVRLGLEF